MIRWRTGYDRGRLRSDAIAGVSLAAFAIPESIAYATLAGLPPGAGLYCYLVGGMGYALFGTSRALAVGPTSALALLLASSLAPLAHGDAARYGLLTAATAVTVGILCIVGRVVHVGVVMSFVSTVVLTGFAAGAGAFIVTTQLPSVFGLPGETGNAFSRLASFIAALPHLDPASTVLGLGAIATLVALRRRFPGRPTTLIVVVVVLVLMHVDAIAQLGIRVVGPIPNGLPRPAFPLAGLDLSELRGLFPVAAACFVLAYVETLTTGRTLAHDRGDVVDPQAELVALGAANVAAGTFAGMPVSGGMSQSAVNDLAGARTPAALLFTSLALAIVLLALASFFSAMPVPLLGAIVIVAALHVARFDRVATVWRETRAEFWVAVFAAVAVLAFGLLDGVLLAVAFSLVMVLVRASRPTVAVIGEFPNTTMYVNVALNPEAVVTPGVLAVRVLGPWQFFNAGFIRRSVLRLVESLADPPAVVVIDFSASPTLDFEAIETLKTIDDELAARGIRLQLARLYDETVRALADARLREPIDPHRTVHDVVEAYRR
jgi:high affinity sulfate transporter 1